MVTDLGHAIDVSIVAEGVENQAELDALRRIGADQVQGYLVSRPLDTASLQQWLEEPMALPI